MLNTHLNKDFLKRPKMVPFKDDKERGWPSPFGDFKAPSPPLKSLKISVVKRPKHQSLETCTKRSLTRLRRGQTNPNHKTLLINNQEGLKIELFYVIH